MSTVFTSTFGGSSVSPADVSYAAYVTSTDLILAWPQFSAGNPNVAARFMNIMAGTTGLNIVIPDAMLTSVGQDIIIANIGSNTFNVVNESLGTIVSIASGLIYYIILTDNTTSAGIWNTLQFGAGSSSASSSALAGAGLKANGPLLDVNFSAEIISSSTTLTTAARAVLQTWVGGSGTITLPDAAAVGNGFFFPFANDGSGSVSLAPVGGDLIDNGATAVFTQTQSAFVISSGGAWYTVGKGTQTNFAVTILNLNVAGAGTITETSAQAQNIIQQFTGILTGNINVIMPNTVQLYYTFNNTSGPFTLTMKTSAGSGIVIPQGSHTILYCDGTNIVNAFTSTFGGGISLSPGSASSPNLNFIGSPSTGIFSPAVGQFAITSNGKQAANFVSAASAVNYLEFDATVTGSAPVIAAIGNDTNIGIILSPKGTGAVGIPSVIILGGTIDGTVIGATTPAAITGTTITGANFIGPLTGNVTGNSSTATALQTARTIGGISFDGTSNITVSSATSGFTISGGDLNIGANNIGITGSIGLTGSRVTKGWFTGLEVTNPIVGSITGNASTVTTNANLTGDVTSSGNATTIASNIVTNAKLAAMAADTVKVNATASLANPTDLALALNNLLGRGSTGDISAITLGTYLAMSGTVLDAKSNASNVIASTGSYTFPGGLIIKWGIGVATGSIPPGANTTQNISFATPFPNALFLALATNSSSANFLTISTYSYSVGSFIIAIANPAAAGAPSFNVTPLWFAIGF